MRNKHKDSQDLAEKDSERLHWIIHRSYAGDQNLILWISMAELDQSEETISFIVGTLDSQTVSSGLY